MLTLAKYSVSLYIGNSGRCNTASGQNEIFCQSKMLFPLIHVSYKICNIEANKTLSFEHGTTGQNGIFSLIFTG